MVTVASRLPKKPITLPRRNKVIENYEYGGNYYIILVDTAYDVPGKASDNEGMFDACE